MVGKKLGDPKPFEELSPGEIRCVPIASLDPYQNK